MGEGDRFAVVMQRKLIVILPNTEEIPERVDTRVEGSNNARALPAAHTQRWTLDMHGGQSASKANIEYIGNNKTRFIDAETEFR